MPKTSALLRELREALAAQGSIERARGARAYLKSELEFLGVTVPELRRQVKAFTRANKALPKAQIVALCDALWASRVNELRGFAIGVLEQRQADFDRSDFPWLVSFADRADTWAHVDWLAIKVIGAVVQRDRDTRRELRSWAKHSNFWVRRTALLALHDPLITGKGDFELWSELAASMLGEKEFFIRKAIGWVLRDTSRRHAAQTIGFVERFAKQLAPLSFREATRNLPEATQARLRSLRDA